MFVDEFCKFILKKQGYFKCILEPLKIFIGYDKEAVAYHTCVQSILDNTNVPVSITPLNLKCLKIIKKITQMEVMILYIQDFNT